VPVAFITFLFDYYDETYLRVPGFVFFSPEFDTLYALRPLKPNTSAGCSSKFEKVVGRKPFGKTDGTHYF